MGTNLADFIREAHRVLKDDGILKIAEVRSRLEYSYSANTSNTKQQSQSADDNEDEDEDEGEKGNKKKKNNKSNNNNKSAGTLEEFIQVLDELGFECKRIDKSNKMFVLLELKKNNKRPNKKLTFTARPCIYKRR